MALKKRGKTWHCHFVVNGQRFRQSLETTDWREAQAKEKGIDSGGLRGQVAPDLNHPWRVSRSDWRQTIT
jgi:hypothetical protein